MFRLTLPSRTKLFSRDWLLFILQNVVKTKSSSSNSSEKTELKLKSTKVKCGQARDITEVLLLNFLLFYFREIVVVVTTLNCNASEPFLAFRNFTGCWL